MSFVKRLDKRRVISDKEFRELWFECGRRCQRCGKQVELHKAIKAHIIPHTDGVRKGGVSTKENTFVSCESCNKVDVTTIEDLIIQKS